MKAQSDPGKSGLGGAPPYRWGSSSWDAILNAWGAAFAPVFQEPAQAAMAAVSRCANVALSQQLQNAYAGAQWARDSAQAAAALADKECPAGPARAMLHATLARNVADAERAMREVLRIGREHGHLAFAFPVHG